jgi:hypothetical protein
MTLRINNQSGIAALALLFICLAPGHAQNKPPESTSKVKKVLLYNKIGGWVSVNGIAETKAVFTQLSESKDFELVQSENDTDLTSEFLSQFQAIIWNNNTNGQGSVPSPAARQAVIDYLEQGGGWLLIGMASDHANSWPALSERLGTSFTRHGSADSAQIVLDSAAKAHRELRWMVGSLPDVFVLKDLFPSFSNTVRPLPGVTVVATARNLPGKESVVTPPADGSGDNVYIWAREVGRGRLFHNPIGYSQALNPIMAQQDSIVPKLYWEHLRYVAGDYQNGCTTPSAPGFDLAAPEGTLRARLRNLRGRLVWERNLPAGTEEIVLDGALEPGLHHFELQGTAGAFRSRLLLP